jgi:hypothetical protein
MTNLPMPRDGRPPVPIPAQMAQLFAVTLPDRDMGADVRAMASFLSNVLAPLLDGVREYFPRPLPCAICGVDMVRWDDRTRVQHWGTHGLLARALAKVRLGAQ